MSAGPETVQAAHARRLELREILNRRYVYIDRKWDVIFLISAAFVIAAAGDLTRLLFAGDWDFWVDWKDRQWWPMLTPFATIIIPSAIQYIAWLGFRLPLGATYTALCLFLAAWIARLYQFDAFVSYPLTLVWPATVVPAAILIDFVLLKSRSFVLTSILGGIIWTFAFWISNYVTLAAYLQPSLFMGHLLTLADVLGIQYLRSQTPERHSQIVLRTLQWTGCPCSALPSRRFSCSRRSVFCSANIATTAPPWRSVSIGT